MHGSDTVAYVYKVQKCSNGVTDHVWDKRRKICNVLFFFKYSQMRSLEKNNGLYL